MQNQAWWDVVTGPAEPQGYFLGGLISGASDFIGDAFNAGKNFVSNNPFTTGGALIGGATNGWKGAATGALLGAGGDALFTPGSYSSQFLGTNGNTTGIFGGAGGFSNGYTPSGSYTSPTGAPSSATTGIGYSAPTTGFAAGAPSVGASSVSAPVASGGATTGMFGGAGVDYSLPTSSGIGGTGAGLGLRAGGTALTEGAGAGSAFDKVTAGVKGLSAWGKANPELAQLGIQGVGALLGNKKQGQADQLMADAGARATEANNFNRGVAEASNRDAQQTIDDARSTTNPYNMATQSYAQAQMAGQRGIDRIESAGLSSGSAPATVNAEKRRAKLSTALGATTAYNSGFRTGAEQQRAGVSSGNAMRRTLTPSGYDSSLGNALTQSGNQESQQITSLLENYLGNPSDVAKRKRTEANGELAQ